MDERELSEQLDRLAHALPASAPPPDLVTSARRGRRNRRLVAGVAVVAVVATTTGVAAAVVGGTPGREAGPTSEPAVDELSGEGGGPCPVLMPHVPGSEGRGFGTSVPAPRAPDPPDAERGWICRYDARAGAPGADDEGDYVAWVRVGRVVQIDAEALTSLAAPLRMLAPQEVPGCDANLGPRWLLVTATGNDLTGYAVDGFGCRTVRMTDDPPASEPGIAEQPGTVSGALEDGSDLVRLLSAIYLGTPAGDAVLDSLTISLVVGTSGSRHKIPSQLFIDNETDATVTDPGCRTTANFRWGLVPASDPESEPDRWGMSITRCGGPHDLPPGYHDLVRGPAFDTTGLPPGDYLAVIDFGDARSERLLVPVQLD